MAKAKMRLGMTGEPMKPDLSTLPRTLDECEALAIDFVELSTYDMDLVVGGRIRKDHLRRLKGILKGRRLAWSVHGPLGINLFDEERIERHLAVLRASIEVAAEIGARNYVLHAGVLYQASPRHEAMEARARQCGHLSAVAEWAHSHGVVVCVENLFLGEARKHTQTPTELAADLKAVDHAAVRATLDFSHAHQQATMQGLDVIGECAALAPFAEHLHIHDSFGLPDDIWMCTKGENLAFGHGDLHMPTGWGDVPWSRLVATCRFPRGCWGNIELEHRWWDEREACVGATRKAFAPLLGG